MYMVTQDKKQLREDILGKLKKQSFEKKTRENNLIKSQVLSSKGYQEAELIFTYVSTDFEVDTWEIIKMSLKNNKRVSVPVITDYKNREMIISEIKDVSKLEKNKWGIYQPKKGNILEMKKDTIDLMLIPGVAFDKKGNRLGKGKGFFDKFLTNVKNIPVLGLAFSLQIVSSIPVIQTDIPVSKVVSA